MFARIEVAVRPDLSDSAAQNILRRVELVSSNLRQKIRWARVLDVYWIEVPISREEFISAITEVCWDKVLQWIFTGNLIPSAAGKAGGLQDLMELAPYRPGKFWGIERRFRPGVTDSVGRTLLEAFEIVLSKKIPDARASSGGLLVVEGSDLNEDSLASIAREVFCNELVQTWTLIPEEGLRKNDRFHQERVKYDLPKVNFRGLSQVETFSLDKLNDEELKELSKKRLWALNLTELHAIRNYFSQHSEHDRRNSIGLADPTDVEIEIIAQTWSEHCKHKIFNSKIYYQDQNSKTIPKEIESLFKTTILETTLKLKKPWILSAFHDNAGIFAIDDEDAFCIKVETHNSPSALDPYGGALTGILGVNRDILGCGLGAKPIFNTNVFCLATPDYSKELPERILHPRRILEGVRLGVEHGGNKSGIPTVNGALVFDDRYLGKPLIYCGSGGVIPRKIAGIPCETKKILPGDQICVIGGRIGKDGIHGATFSSLALDELSPLSAVQLGDPLTQKRVTDFLLEARDLGLYRAITDNGAGGLSSSIGEMALLSGGATIDLSLAKVKYPGLKPFELMVSESQERMSVAVPPECIQRFTSLAEQRGVEVSVLGEFTHQGRLEVFYSGQRVADLDLKFLHEGLPKLELVGEFEAPKMIFESSSSDKKISLDYETKAGQILLNLLNLPNVASKEWLIRQYDHEVQGMSVIKPLHTVATGTPQAFSGPNDASVLKVKPNSDLGIAVGCGINVKLSDVDPYLMAQACVDESIRNVLSVGAEFGTPESVLALVDNFCWPDPVGNAKKTASLVRACFGLRDAALSLATPIISGKDSMKNDYRGRVQGQEVLISVPPTLLITATGRVLDVKQARTSDFKLNGDIIYAIGHMDLGLLGTEFQNLLGPSAQNLTEYGTIRVGQPAWDVARVIYGWLGKATGKLQSRLKSLHDISDGGLLVSVAECLLGRGLGAQIEIPEDVNPWEFSFGEGFHSFVGSAASEDSLLLEAEWQSLGIPFKRLGKVDLHSRIEVLQKQSQTGQELKFSVETKKLRSAWLKEGYWE